MTPSLSQKIAAHASRKGITFNRACSEIGRRGANVRWKTGYPSPAIRPPVVFDPHVQPVVAQPRETQLNLLDMSRSPYEIHQ